MENNVMIFLANYLKENTSNTKVINNQEIDHLLQTRLEMKPVGEVKIRALIHYMRVNMKIKNDAGEEGWICADSDGYYLSFNPIHIMKHLERHDGKIEKMMLVRQKGYDVLKNKVFYRQSRIKFNHD